MQLVNIAGAAAGVVGFLYLFHLGWYDGYNTWPQRYHFPDEYRLCLWGGPGGGGRGSLSDAQQKILTSLAARAGVAGAVAALLIGLISHGAPKFGWGNAPGVKKSLHRAALPLQSLWCFILAYVCGVQPDFFWLFVFLALVSLSAVLLGLSWPERPAAGPRPTQGASPDLSQGETVSPGSPKGTDRRSDAASLSSNAASGASEDAALPPIPKMILALLAAGILAFILLFSTLTILQYHAGNFGYADSGFVAEALWNTLHGRFLYAHGFQPPMLLADHFSPIWLALLPIYAMVPRHEALMVVSAVVIGITAIPVFLLARWEWRDNRAALCLALAVLLHPACQHEVSSFSYGFQAEVVALPLLAWACYFMRRKQWIKFWLFIFLVLSCKETLSALVFGVGLCLWALERDWRRGAAVMAFAVAWLFIVTRAVIPWLKGGGEYYQLGFFYGHLGKNYSEILVNILTKLFTAPAATLREVLHREVWMFLAQMLLPLGLLSLLSPAVLVMAFPHFFLMLFSQKPQFFSIFHHYKDALVIIPFFAAAVGVRQLMDGRGAVAWAAARIANRLPKGLWRPTTPVRGILQGVALGLVAASFLHCYYFGPTPRSRTFEPKLITLSPKSLALARMKDRIGLDASVTATHRAGAHLTDRRQLYVLPPSPWLRPEVFYEVDYILLDTNDDWGDPRGEVLPGMLKMLSERKDYELAVRDHTYLLFRKKR